MSPRTLDHVALWVTERGAIADACVERLGMHVIERTDTFTLIGFDARRGKLTLFDAEGPRDRGALKHVAFGVPGGGDELELPDGLVVRVVEGDGDIDHVAIFRALRDAGFSGPCLIERIDGLETPEEVDRELARGREYLERSVAEVDQTNGGDGR